MKSPGDGVLMVVLCVRTQVRAALIQEGFQTDADNMALSQSNIEFDSASQSQSVFKISV